jgi:hypothetical protein
MGHRPGSRLLFAALCLQVASCESCEECPTARPTGLINRPALKVVDATGAFTVTARCEAGEQLLGGGYRFEPPIFPRDSQGNILADADGNRGGHELTVTASYPSEDGTSWIVRLVNPDRGPHGGNMGSFVVAVAYCLPTSVVDLGMEVRSAHEPMPLNNVVNTLKVPAPQGAVVTAGGFEMSYQDERSLLPGYNGFATASTPVIENGTAIGWQVGKMPTFDGQPAGMTGYVLFSTRNLSAGTSQRVKATTDGLGYGSYAATPQCGDGEFTTGGGYEIIGIPDQAYFIPHYEDEDVAFPGADGWRVHAIYGFQAPTANPMSGLDAPTTAGVFASVICLKSPRPALCVRIKTPSDATSLDLESGDPAKTTQLISFTGQAFRGNKALDPSALTWTVDGAPLGTGNSLSAALPLPAPVASNASYYHEFHVTLTAKDGPDVASQTIILYAVRTVIL